MGPTLDTSKRIERTYLGSVAAHPAPKKNAENSGGLTGTSGHLVGGLQGIGYRTVRKVENVMLAGR